MADSDNNRRRAQPSGDYVSRGASAYDFGQRRDARAPTLAATVETVRRILRADTTSIATFSVADRTVKWLAMSGFQSVEAGGEIVNPLRGEFAERIADV